MINKLAPLGKVDDVSVFRTVNVADADTLLQTEQLLGQHKYVITQFDYLFIFIYFCCIVLIVIFRGYVYSRLKELYGLSGDPKKIKEQIEKWAVEKPTFWEEVRRKNRKIVFKT
jgi:hypothetical protein